MVFLFYLFVLSYFICEYIVYFVCSYYYLYREHDLYFFLYFRTTGNTCNGIKVYIFILKVLLCVIMKDILRNFDYHCLYWLFLRTERPKYLKLPRWFRSGRILLYSLQFAPTQWRDCISQFRSVLRVFYVIDLPDTSREKRVLTK